MQTFKFGGALCAAMLLVACSSTGPLGLIGGSIEQLSAEDCTKLGKAESVGDADAKLSCDALNAAITNWKVASDRRSTNINYPAETKDEPALLADLSSSIRHYAPKGETVSLGFPATVNLKPADLVTLTPGKPANGLLPWLQAVKDSGGQVCQRENVNGVLIPTLLLDFIVPKVVPKLIGTLTKKAANAQLFAPTKDVNAVIWHNRDVPGTKDAGKVTAIQFIPRSKESGCLAT